MVKWIYVNLVKDLRGGEWMEYFGVLAFILIMCYMAYPGKVKRLEKEVVKLKRALKGDDSMSKLINELKGYKCKLSFNDVTSLLEDDNQVYEIIDVDDEWVKITFKNKKGVDKRVIVRIETIDRIELVD